MPNTKSATKRHLQSRARRDHHRSVRSEIRTRTRKLLAMTAVDEAGPALQKLYSLLDRAARRRILHPNVAARNKARLARHVERLRG